MKLIKEKNGIAIYEARTDKVARYFVVEIDDVMVISIIPEDNPQSGGRWYAERNCKGVRAVSKPRKHSTAYRWFRKLVKEREVK